MEEQVVSSANKNSEETYYYEVSRKFSEILSAKKPLAEFKRTIEKKNNGEYVFDINKSIYPYWSCFFEYILRHPEYNQNRSDMLVALLDLRTKENNPVINLHPSPHISDKNNSSLSLLHMVLKAISDIVRGYSGALPERLNTKVIIEKILNLRDNCGHRCLRFDLRWPSDPLILAIESRDSNLLRLFLDIRNADGTYCISPNGGSPFNSTLDVAYVGCEKRQMEEKSEEKIKEEADSKESKVEEREIFYHERNYKSVFKCTTNPEMIEALKWAGALRAKRQEYLDYYHSLRKYEANLKNNPVPKCPSGRTIKLTDDSPQASQNPQSIHLKEVNQTVVNAINKLKEHYPLEQIDIKKSIEEIASFVDNLDSNSAQGEKKDEGISQNDIAQIRKGFDFIRRYDASSFKCFYTELTNEQTLVLVWKAANDPAAICEGQESIADVIVKNRREALLTQFKEMLSTYAQGNDTDSVICFSGIRDKLITSLECSHPDVLIASTKEQLSFILRKSCEQTLNNMFAKQSKKNQIAIIESWSQLEEDTFISHESKTENKEASKQFLGEVFKTIEDKLTQSKDYSALAQNDIDNVLETLKKGEIEPAFPSHKDLRELFDKIDAIFFKEDKSALGKYKKAMLERLKKAKQNLLNDVRDGNGENEDFPWEKEYILFKKTFDAYQEAQLLLNQLKGHNFFFVLSGDNIGNTVINNADKDDTYFFIKSDPSKLIHIKDKKANTLSIPESHSSILRSLLEATPKIEGKETLLLQEVLTDVQLAQLSDIVCAALGEGAQVIFPNRSINEAFPSISVLPINTIDRALELKNESKEKDFKQTSNQIKELHEKCKADILKNQKDIVAAFQKDSAKKLRKIKLLIDKLNGRANNFGVGNEAEKAYFEAKKLAGRLEGYLNLLAYAPIQDGLFVIQKAKEDIKDAKSVLSKHRGYKEVLFNLAIAFTGIGLLFLSAKAIYSYCKTQKVTLFCLKTKSRMILDHINLEIEEISSKKIK